MFKMSNAQEVYHQQDLVTSLAFFTNKMSRSLLDCQCFLSKTKIPDFVVVSKQSSYYVVLRYFSD